jgi:aldose 1-epimerase
MCRHDLLHFFRNPNPTFFAIPMPDSIVHGTLPDGREVKLFTLRNAHGMCAKFTEMGACLVSLEVPDSEGRIADVTLGYESFEDWRKNPAYLGATVGRFGNRIRDGHFVLDGQRHQLATNNQPGGMPSHLHGGDIGFDKVVWRGQASGQSVVFRYSSIDGEEGYPGNLEVEVTYSLNDRNELIWEARATTDAPTIINVVHHTYWNLTGDSNQSVLDHELLLAADHFLPTDAGLIPTGEKSPVEGTPMDFTKPRRIGERIHDDFAPLHLAGGYDHCWVLRNLSDMQLAADVRDPVSGRRMELLTNQPGLQFYSGNFLDGTIMGKKGILYGHRSGFCLESENFPDSPNQPSFPSSILRPGELYHHRMIHRFSF